MSIISHHLNQPGVAGTVKGKSMGALVLTTLDQNSFNKAPLNCSCKRRGNLSMTQTVFWGDLSQHGNLSLASAS